MDEMSKYSALVGERMRKIREMRGCSQEDIAGSLGKSPSYYSSIERGDHSPSIDYVERIAFALGVKIEALLSQGESDPKLQDLVRENRLLESIVHRFDQLPYRKQQCMLMILDNLFCWGEGEDGFPEIERLEESMLRYAETRIDQQLIWEVTERTFESSEIGCYVSYGIAAYRIIDRKKVLLDCIEDIHMEKSIVVRLTDEIQINDLSIIHFKDVVEDLVEGNYELLLQDDGCALI